jgi:hypothetical protein
MGLFFFSLHKNKILKLNMISINFFQTCNALLMKNKKNNKKHKIL